MNKDMYNVVQYSYFPLFRHCLYTCTLSVKGECRRKLSSINLTNSFIKVCHAIILFGINKIQKLIIVPQLASSIACITINANASFQYLLNSKIVSLKTIENIHI